jgi:hypothetical protein
MPGARRRTETTMVVSSTTLPVAGIYFLATFMDDPAQFCALGFGKNLGTARNGGKTLFAIRLTKPVDLSGHFRQLRRGQRLEVFNDNFQCAHQRKSNPSGIPDKPLHQRNQGQAGGSYMPPSSAM